MADECLERIVVLTNPTGLHARPANLFVQCALKYQAKIEIVKDSQRVDGKSILDLLMLGAQVGTELRIEATGSDAEAALDALADLVAQKFFEDEHVEP